MLAGENLLEYTNLFFRMNRKQYKSILKINMVEVADYKLRLRKIEKTRNYILDEIKHMF